MNTHTTKLLAAPSANLTTRCNIVLIFNDREVATVARKSLNRLFFKCADDFDVHYDEWSIDELEHAEFRSEALDLARHCDIFVIAANAFSESFVDFVSEWLNSDKASDAALVLMQPAGLCPASARLARLRQLANDSGVTCFSTMLLNSPNSAPRTFCPNRLSVFQHAQETSPLNE